MFTLTIVEVEGKKAFKLGNIRVDELSVHHLLPTGKFPKVIVMVFRKGMLVDKGWIEETGTYGSARAFFGFQKSLPPEPGHLAESPLKGNMRASWFRKGDRLTLNTPASVIKQNLQKGNQN